MAENLFGLPPEERLIRFRELAREALERSGTAQQQYLKDGYAQVSRAWERMALRLEAEIKAEGRDPA